MTAAGKVTLEMAERYFKLFVNRGAYTVQSMKPDQGGKYYYYRPKGERRLDAGLIVRHLRGEITIGLYAINPKTQRSKWIAIDADYNRAFEDLLRIQLELKKDGVQSALERSRRGAHLWMFTAVPLLASHCRLYICNLATRLNLPIKTSGTSDGIEVFPRQDRLEFDEFGNAIRGPLGVHRGAAGKRYWFYGANVTFQSQIAYLERLEKITEQQLTELVSGLTLPASVAPKRVEIWPPYNPTRSEFRILEHVPKGKRSGKDYRTKCPSCVLVGQDKNNDNLAINVADPRKYRCWRGCTKEQIRSALGCPIRHFTGGSSWQMNRLHG